MWDAGRGCGPCVCPCRLRGSGEVIKREEFEKRKAAAAAARNARLNKRPKKLASQGKDLSSHPLLQARFARERLSRWRVPVRAMRELARGAQELQRREEAVRNGKLATIVFVRDLNAKGQEVSGYIDLGARLGGGGMEAVFALKQRFLPRPTDLSFFNWDTHGSSTNPTMDFQVRRLISAAFRSVKQRAGSSKRAGAGAGDCRQCKRAGVQEQAGPQDDQRGPELTPRR